MSKLITSETGITLTMVGVIIGAVAWLSDVNHTATASAKQLERVEVRQDSVDANIMQIMLDIKEIKTILKSNNRETE